MLVGAHYSGKAINLSKTTAPHALSYGLTRELGLPHGHAVALTLGAFFAYHRKLLLNKNELHDKQLRNFTKIDKILLKITKEDSEKFIYSLMLECKMEYDLEALKLDQDLINKIVNGVNLERLNNHPVSLNASDLIEIFKYIPKKCSKI